MTRRRAHPARMVDAIAGAWWSWTIARGALTIGLVAADVAVGESIDGAPTVREQWLVDVATTAAVVMLPVGVAAGRSLIRSPRAAAARSSRRTLAVMMAAVAIGLAVTRVPMQLSRVLWHVSLDADEPLTSWSLVAQLSVSVAVASALFVVAGVEYRRVTVPDPYHRGAGGTDHRTSRAAPDDPERTTA